MRVFRRSIGMAFAAIIAAALTGCGGDDNGSTSISGGAPPAGNSTVTVLSSRPDMVSGGTAVVAVAPPAGFAATNLSVSLNNTDVTGTLKVDAQGRLAGTLTGLAVGNNTLAVNGPGVTPNNVTLVNYPITGPIFSGPHETPFICQTSQFLVPGSTTQTLGSALDADCSIATRVDYVYRATDNTFKPLPTPTTRPSDMVTTTTSTGKTVAYIVRVETGTIDRAVYQTAVLSDPTVDTAPSITAPPSAWNQRLVYTFGGGCAGGWYIQGAKISTATGGGSNTSVLEDFILRQGYAIASSSLNVFGNNCNAVLAAEASMMVKERFVKAYGVPAITIGFGCSGGSEQLQPMADEYPGIVDGIVIGCSFPEVAAGMILNIGEADLFYHYITTTTTSWSTAAQLAVSGYPNTTTPANLSGQNSRIKAIPTGCNVVVPAASIYNPTTNRSGVRCDLYDHLVNIFGRDPDTQFARRGMDNVGVQYGLQALNAGQITTTQFLDINANIGGFDNDGNYVAARTVADASVLSRLYTTGQITYGGLGLKSTPIIDYRGYVDTPENSNEVHSRFHSFSMRARLMAANGTFANQVMLIEGSTGPNQGLFSFASPILTHTVTQMDQWLTSLKAATNGATPTIAQITAAQPADLQEACFSNAGATKIVETQVYSGATACNALFPAYSTPRLMAGSPLSNDVLKCTLKPVAAADYKVTFTAAEFQQLQTIFPNGVCNFAVPGVGQVPTAGTWQRL